MSSPLAPASALIASQLTEDFTELVQRVTGGAPSFSPKPLHNMKWTSHALATSGARMHKEEQQFVAGANAMGLSAMAVLVLVDQEAAAVRPFSISLTIEELVALKQAAAGLSVFFRPMESLESPALADGFAGLIQPHGRVVVAGPASLMNQLRNPTLDGEKARVASESAALTEADRKLFSRQVDSTSGGI